MGKETVKERISKGVKRFVQPYRVTDGERFRLKHIDPEDTGELTSEHKKQSREFLQEGISLLSDLQAKLYAENRWAVLLAFQAMDAAGKDGAIKHVMSGINPQGCQVYSFKAPSNEELDHDFLWRTTKSLPERGRIGIFNRSYYEEVLVVRVHPELLRKQRLPPSLVTKRIWEQRYKDIRAFERYLTRNGVVIRKFFLHLSKEEQKRRFLKRLEDSDRNWKFSMADARERGHWDAYMEAYEDMIRHTATKHAPWFVVPADNKWYTRLVVAAAVIDAMQELDLRFPVVDAEKRKELQAARTALLSERKSR